MADVLVPPLAQTAEISVPAGARVAVSGRGAWVLRQVSASVNYPDTTAPLKIQGAGAAAQFQSDVLSASLITTVTLENLDAWSPLYYSIGVNATVLSGMQRANGVQPDPNALNADGALTAAMILGGIVTSTTAAATAGTIPTGTVMDAATTMAINDYVDWSIINTGPSAFTVTSPGASHTVVGGSGAAFVVPTLTAAIARTRKTAANTFITYSIARAVS